MTECGPQALTLPGDTRPRIYITLNRDGISCRWSYDPAPQPFFALSAGAALDAAIDGLDGSPAVIILSGRPEPRAKEAQR